MKFSRKSTKEFKAMEGILEGKSQGITLWKFVEKLSKELARRIFKANYKQNVLYLQGQPLANLRGTLLGNSLSFTVPAL